LAAGKALRATDVVPEQRAAHGRHEEGREPRREESPSGGGGGDGCRLTLRTSGSAMEEQEEEEDAEDASGCEICSECTFRIRTIFQCVVLISCHSIWVEQLSKKIFCFSFLVSVSLQSKSPAS